MSFFGRNRSGMRRRSSYRLLLLSANASSRWHASRAVFSRNWDRFGSGRGSLVDSFFLKCTLCVTSPSGKNFGLKGRLTGPKLSIKH